jgi:hypothetical protein
MFLKNKDGNIVSAIPLISGTKDDPFKLSKKGCCIQHDGVLAECNVPPVKKGEWELFWENFQFVKDYIKTTVCKPKNLDLVCCASGDVPESEMQSKEAKELGCSSDFNAWKDGEINPKPKAKNKNFRTCGFHVHFSLPEMSIFTAIDLMKCFDTFVTLPFIILDPDDKRRELYGKAGAFRSCQWETSSGFEARTLSNFVLTNKNWVKFLFNQIDVMFEYYQKYGMSQINSLSGDIVDVINNSKKDRAYEICDIFGIELPKTYKAKFVL